MLSYRSLVSNVPEMTSSLNTGTSITPISPLIAGAGTWLAVRVCAMDANEVPATEADFYPSGTNGRQATELTGVGDGCGLGTADDTDPATARTWNPDASEQWGCLTIRFSAEPGTAGVVDISGGQSTSHDGQTTSTITTVTSELRL